MLDCSPNTLSSQQKKQQTWGKQEQVHLDGDAEAVKETSPRPMTSQEQIHCDVEEEHGQRVIEESQYINGVDAI
uniref:Uncharacterized protein n=1 Tax=Arion vulgaris TaxID=1028688 RepID=A0A0B7ACE0_9EUPU